MKSKEIGKSAAKATYKVECSTTKCFALMNLGYIVYETTNLINGKVYVGVHKMDLDNPDSYIGCGVSIKNKQKANKKGFPAAVRKYGYNNFRRKILFTYPDTEEGFLAAYKKEAEIVNLEWVNSDKNYNLVPGGRITLSYTLYKTINQYSIEGKFIKTWPSSIEASNTLDCSMVGIRDVCRKGRGICNNFQWRYYKGDTENIEAYEFKQIYQYDLSGNLLKVWKSITEASKEFTNPNSARVQIEHVISPQYKDTQAFGYYWNNKRKFEYCPPKDIKTAVACYSIKGEFIRSFTSLSDAAEFYDLSIGNLCSTLKGKHKTCKNLRWRYFYGNTSNISPLS